MNNNIQRSNKKMSTITIISKESKRKKLIRLGALLGAIVMFGTFCISLILNMV